MNHCASCGGVVGRDCFNEVECAEITQNIISTQNEGESAEVTRRLREVLNLLIGYALTARSDSTAWLEGLAYRINEAADVLGDTDRAVAEGDHLVVRKETA